jgi:DNA-directed RNA polymerase specialized sigma24 family protein
LLVEALRERLSALGDETLRAIALAKLHGDSNREIAEQLGLGLRSVERKLGLIRDIWQLETSDE